MRRSHFPIISQLKKKKKDYNPNKENVSNK